MLRSNQVFPANFTIVAIAGEEIHAEIIQNNGGFSMLQQYSGLEISVCDTI
jgi:hypothetical protein